jgi:AcrR family transcriptional regulator
VSIINDYSFIVKGFVNVDSFIYHEAMPRPRTVADDAILEATFRVIGRLGPANLTLAHVAKEIDLSPATLLQRFGSKRGLLLALAKSAAESVEECFSALRAEHKSPLAALVAGALTMARMTTSPEELSNGLAFLQMDLSDPEFHQIALENSTRLQKGYQKLIDEAVVAGELMKCDAGQLARAVEAVSGGSIIAWAIHRKGTAAEWVAKDLETLLDPYRRPWAKARERKPGRRT